MSRLLRVLLVEDSRTDAFLFKYAFSKINPNFQFTVCEDGEQAINYIRDRNNGCEYLDLILLDMNLPRKNGLEVLREIKRISELDHICVAVYSTSNDRDMIREIYNAGAEYFMNKPAELDKYFSEFSALYATCIGSRN